MAEVRRAIGLMSGTSLDGVDVALIETDGERIAAFGPARTFPYAEADGELFRQAFKRCAGADGPHRPAGRARRRRRRWSRFATPRRSKRFSPAEGIAAADVDLVGFHGQTVFHDPARALTVQIGDGQQLADRLGIPVVWDFRADDMAAGGQGAPLAPVFHRALAETAGLAAPVLFLNLGGVANITYVGADGELIAFDTGPGNALLDDWTLAAHRQALRRGRAACGERQRLGRDPRDAARPSVFRAAAAEIARPRRVFAWRRLARPVRCRRRGDAAPVHGAIGRRRARRICRRGRAPATSPAAGATTRS